MLMKFALFAIFLIFCVSSSCLSNGTQHNMVLEEEDVNFLEVKEEQGVPNLVIISGLSLHSMLSVGEVTQKFGNEEIEIIVKLISPQKGLRGDFRIPVLLTDEVKKIYFGSKKSLIWEKM